VHRGDEKCIKNFVGKYERTISFGKARRGREDNIKMDLMEVRWEDVEWIHLAQDKERWPAPVNTIMNNRVPCNGREFLEEMT
jgi:hypothetical protein